MRYLPFALASSLALAACNKQPAAPATLAITDAVVRLAPVSGRPGAGYFTLHGGAKTDRLIAVSSTKVATIELHENKMENGMMKMLPLTGVDLQKGETVEFKPSGNHAMLFGVDPSVKPGGALPLHFTFQSGAALDVTAKVMAAGDDMSMSDHMNH